MDAGSASPPANREDNTPARRGRALLVTGISALALAGLLRTSALLGVVDFDAAFVLGLYATLAAGWLGVRESRTSREASLFLPWLAASFAVWVAVLMVAGLLQILAPACASGIGWQFILYLPLVSALCAAALGAVAARALRGRLAHAVVPAALVVSTVRPLVRLFREGVMAAYDPFFGHFPGPLYDEVIFPSETLAVYRALCAAGALALVAGADLVALARRPGDRAIDARRRWVTAGVFLCAAAAVALGASSSRALGFRLDREGILRELSGSFESEHFRYHFPPGTWIEEEIGVLAEDHEFRYAQNARFLEWSSKEKIDSFLYETAGQKKRLTGSGETMYADVPGRAIHINARDFPQPTLGHELLHVMTRDFGLPVLGLSLKVGLTEGIAVAAEGFRRDLSVHQWARAMQILDRAPRLEKILGAVGFWREQSTRAYLFAGSFVLFLRETYGAEKLRAVYARGDFAKVYGRALRDLVSEWERFLAGVEVSPAQLRIAEHVLSRRAIFDRPCARQVARLEEMADQALERRQCRRAQDLAARALACQPDNAALLRQIADARAQCEDLPGAEETLRAVLDRPAATPRERDDARLALADLAWRRGRVDEARAGWEQVEREAVDEHLIRGAAFRTAALARPENDARFLLSSIVTPDRADGADLGRFVERRPDDALGWYLLGRRLYNRRAWPEAASALARATTVGLPGEALSYEALRLLGLARYRIGDLPGAIAAFLEMGARPLPTGREMLISELVERCIFAGRYRGTPLPEGGAGVMAALGSPAPTTRR